MFRVCSLFRQSPNLNPQHRRFIAENSAYAVMRIAPVFFTKSLPVLLVTVISYFVEVWTICREIIKYKAPSDAMVPLTLLTIFATVTTYTATVNTDDYITEVDPMVLMAMQVSCGLCWACWVSGFVANATAKKD